MCVCVVFPSSFIQKATDMDVSGGDGGRTAPSIQLTVGIDYNCATFCFHVDGL